MQTARNLVAAAAELAAGVQDGENDLDGGQTGGLLYSDGYAAPVVRDADDVVRLDDDVDLAAHSGQSLVDGVVHHLIDEMVQTARAGRADIHAGALAHGLEALEYLYL